MKWRVRLKTWSRSFQFAFCLWSHCHPRIQVRTQSLILSAALGLILRQGLLVHMYARALCCWSHQQHDLAAPLREQQFSVIRIWVVSSDNIFTFAMPCRYVATQSRVSWKHVIHLMSANLKESLRYFEVLHKDDIQHHVSKRSVVSDSKEPEKVVQLTTLGRWRVASFSFGAIQNFMPMRQMRMQNFREPNQIFLFQTFRPALVSTERTVCNWFQSNHCCRPKPAFNLHCEQGPVLWGCSLRYEKTATTLVFRPFLEFVLFLSGPRPLFAFLPTDSESWSRVHAFFDTGNLVAKIELEEDTYVIEVKQHALSPAGSYFFWDCKHVFGRCGDKCFPILSSHPGHTCHSLIITQWFPTRSLTWRNLSRRILSIILGRLSCYILSLGCGFPSMSSIQLFPASEFFFHLPFRKSFCGFVRPDGFDEAAYRSQNDVLQDKFPG